MQAYRVERIISEDGTVTLEGLPFQAGEAVEIIILPHFGSVSKSEQYPLRGSPMRYEHPTEPVAETDWETHN